MAGELETSPAEREDGATNDAALLFRPIDLNQIMLAEGCAKHKAFCAIEKHKALFDMRQEIKTSARVRVGVFVLPVYTREGSVD